MESRTENRTPWIQESRVDWSQRRDKKIEVSEFWENKNMIPKNNLIILAKQKLLDWKVLFRENYIDDAVYLCGYWIEIALKLCICKIFEFNDWFPENSTEFTTYSRQQRATPLEEVIQDIKSIRNHNLNKLLFFSWLELKIKEKYLEEWEIIIRWNEILRYKVNHSTREEAEKFIKSTEKLLTFIL